MAKDKYRAQFANATASAFQSEYSDIFAEAGETGVFDARAVYDSLEAPKDPTKGRFSFPVFRYARLLKQKPPEIATKIAERTRQNLSALGEDQIVDCEALGGFLNGRVDPIALTTDTLSTVLKQDRHFGDSDIGRDQTYLVEYSSPNIAKPFGIGHLRSTILGHSLRRIYKKLGYTVVGTNYPGDWGTQFGKMIVAFQKWGDDQTLEGDAVKNLLALYVRFHREAHTDESLDNEARAAFKKLESGDAEAVKLWEMFKKVSYAEFDRVYGRLGIEFDWTYGESLLNDKMEPMIERLRNVSLTSHSQGALVVEVGDENMPPLLLRKSDGATLYATRDLAGLAYRWEMYPHFYESLYIVNVAQSDHFKQCFKVIDLLETAEKLPESDRMTGRVKHVDFGWVRFDGAMMSTREGNTVLLDDVIDEATRLAGKIISDKNPDLDQAGEIAEMIGVGAVIFSQISVKRQRDIDFKWSEVLNFEGETGPYLQYTHARLNSVLKKFGGEVSAAIDFSLLNYPEEQRVVELLTDFPKVVIDAGRHYEPYFIASHLLRLAASFNKVYQRKDANGKSDKIISDNADLTAARIALVKAVQTTVAEGLYLLGLEAPKAM